MEKIKLPISVIIHTKNADKTIEKALMSTGWANEVCVIDMASSDNTLQIAKKYTDKIFSVDDVGFADPMRNYGLNQASQPWTLVIDADEEIQPDLVRVIKEIIESNIFKAWNLPRKNLLFGKWLEHANWWPDYQLRLFPSRSVKWTDKVHTPPETNLDIDFIPAKENLALIHHNYLSVADFVDRMNRYTTHELSKDRHSLDKSAVQVLADDFLARFFAFEGHKDKTHGLHVSLMQAFYELVAYLKKWEIEGFPDLTHDFLFEIEKLKKSFHYWKATYKIETSKNLIERFYWRIRRKLML